MYFYAQLNNDNLCVSVSQSSSKTENLSLIPLDSMNNDYLWRKYEKNKWSAERFEPESIIFESILDNAQTIILAKQMGLEVDEGIKEKIINILQDKIEELGAV